MKHICNQNIYKPDNYKTCKRNNLSVDRYFFSDKETKNYCHPRNIQCILYKTGNVQKVHQKGQAKGENQNVQRSPFRNRSFSDIYFCYTAICHNQDHAFLSICGKFPRKLKEDGTQFQPFALHRSITLQIQYPRSFHTIQKNLMGKDSYFSVSHVMVLHRSLFSYIAPSSAFFSFFVNFAPRICFSPATVYI